MKSTKKASPVSKSNTVGLFDIVGDLSYGKSNVIRKGGCIDTVALHAYNAFMINRAFSMHLSSVLDAAMMNEASFIDPIMQYDFYFHSLRKQKRYGAWPKTEDDPDIDLLSMTYNVGRSEAHEMKITLTAHQLDTIRAWAGAKGG